MPKHGGGEGYRQIMERIQRAYIMGRKWTTRISGKGEERGEEDEESHIQMKIPRIPKGNGIIEGEEQERNRGRVINENTSKTHTEETDIGRGG